MTIDTTRSAHTLHYIGFDKQTGRILVMHSRTSIEGKTSQRMNHDELSSLFRDDASILPKLSGNDWDNLDVLELTEHAAKERGAPMMVDVAKRKLVPQPTLALIADRTELTGDGVDSLDIRIEVRAANNHVVRKFDGAVKVSTTRGRLSTPGGVVQLKDGVGSITLTSAAETVSSLLVQARAVDDLVATGSLKLEFL